MPTAPQTISTPSTIPLTEARIAQIEAEIADASNSIKAVESETDNLVPRGNLSALDELRALEARDSEVEATAKRKDRINAIKKGIDNLKAEKARLQAHQKALETEAQAIVDKIAYAGDLAMKKQAEFWQAIEELEALKPEVQKWQTLTGPPNNHHPLYRSKIHSEGLVLAKRLGWEGIPRFEFAERSLYGTLQTIFKEVLGE